MGLLAHREDLQNQTIIFTNYSTIQGFGASIMTTRQSTCLSAFVGMVEEERSDLERKDRRQDK